MVVPLDHCVVVANCGYGRARAQGDGVNDGRGQGLLYLLRQI